MHYFEGPLRYPAAQSVFFMSMSMPCMQTNVMAANNTAYNNSILRHLVVGSGWFIYPFIRIEPQIPPHTKFELFCKKRVPVDKAPRFILFILHSSIGDRFVAQ